MSGKHTVYIRNLNENLTISKLKLELKKLFEGSGYRVREIEAHHNLRLKGQAFVSFDDRVDISNVVDLFNTKMMFGKPMNVKIANSESDNVIKDFMTAGEYEQYQKTQRKARLVNRSKPQLKNNKRKRDDDFETQGTTGEKKRTKTVNETIPNHILIITEVPKTVIKQDLSDVFTKFTGVLTINLVAVRQLALVEFKNESDAVECVKQLGNVITIKDKNCPLAYAKK